MGAEKMIYINFPSHRARDYALRELADKGLPKPLAYYSFSRASTGGFYQVDAAQLAALRAAASQHVRFTLLRGPWGDLHRCWEE